MSVTSLRQIRYFVAVANSGSFSAAATQVNVSQPAVGLQIKLLEEKLGMVLFERHSRGISLTRAGATFVDYAKEILSTLDEAERALADMQAAGPLLLKLGITPSLARTILPQLMLITAQKETQLRVSLHEDLSKRLLDLVLTEELDCAFCYDPEPSPDLIVRPLFTEFLYLVGPASVIGNSTKPVQISDLATLPLVLVPRPDPQRMFLENCARRHGIRLRPAVEIDLIWLKHEFLMRYQYCAISPVGLFRADIESGRLAGRKIDNADLTRTMCLVFHRKVTATAIGRLMKVVQTLVQEKLGSDALGWQSLADQPVPKST